MDLISTTSRVQSTGIIGQRATSGESQPQSPRIASIDILDDDSLLHVFYLYRPFLLDEDNARLRGGGPWVQGRWWYKPAQVCQRWRTLIFASASSLGLSLVCTYGTPVADMLAHSPPLPLVVDYFDGNREITAEDEEGAILALKMRGRVRRVRLDMPVTSLQKLIGTMDEEYPVLEYLIVMPPFDDRRSILMLPETLQAPDLRLLSLAGFALPIGSRLLTTAVALVTFCLVMNDPSTYFHPDALLRWLSFMPQLETLAIFFFTAVPNREIEGQPTRIPIITPVILPNLHHLWFDGVSAFLEALVRRVTTPRLEKLQIEFFNQLMSSLPYLQQLLNTTENLRFDHAYVRFYERRVYVRVYSHDRAEAEISIDVISQHLDWQASSVAQISNSLIQMFSTVEHLTLEHEEHSRSSEEHNEVDRTVWRRLLRPFGNVQTLQIDSIGNGFVEQLSRCLELEDGEPPLELLPELQELTYSGSVNSGDAFTSFVKARQNAGRPVTLVRS